MAINIDLNKIKGQILCAKVKALLPESEKYEWDVASEYAIHSMSQRIGLRLRSIYVHKDPRQNVDIYAVHDVYHLDQLVSDDGYLKAVVDKLVQTLVHELARIEKERLKDEHHKHPAVSSETEWPLPAKHRGSRLVREGEASDSEVPTQDDQGSWPARLDAGNVGFDLSQSYGSVRSGISDPASESVTISADTGGGDFSGGGGGSDW